MKRLYLFFAVAVLAGSVLASCGKDDEPKGTIIDTPDSTPKTRFDKWLKSNFKDQYNIEVIYKWDFSKSDFTYNLVPANLNKSEDLVKVVKHVWMEAYDEVTGSPDFMRQYCPKQLMMVGSPAVNPSSRSIVRGTAEGGIMVVLYDVNDVDVTNIYALNSFYFHTMHHEFAHILHQLKPYPKKEFDPISSEFYTMTGWINLKLTDAWTKGFVTSYASSATQEDFVEVIATYVTSTDDDWNDMLYSAGDFGGPAIRKKLDIATRWLQDEWQIDIKQLRSIVRRRSTEINGLF